MARTDGLHNGLCSDRRKVSRVGRCWISNQSCGFFQQGTDQKEDGLCRAMLRHAVADEARQVHGAFPATSAPASVGQGDDIGGLARIAGTLLEDQSDGTGAEAIIGTTTGAKQPSVPPPWKGKGWEQWEPDAWATFPWNFDGKGWPGPPPWWAASGKSKLAAPEAQSIVPPP